MFNKQTKVAIGIPSNDMVHAEFAMALAGLVEYSVRHGLHVVLVNLHSSIIEVGRAQIVEHAIQLKATHLLFLDSDMVFPPDTLVKLLDHRVTVVGCDAVRRRPPHITTAKGLDGKPIDYTDGPPGLVEIEGAPTACLLIEMRLFKKIKPPYFVVKWITGTRYLGEDFYFSRKLRAAGVRVWCDTDIRIGHMGAKTHYIIAGGK